MKSSKKHFSDSPLPDSVFSHYKHAEMFSRTTYLPDGKGDAEPVRVQVALFANGNRFDIDTDEDPNCFYERVSNPRYNSIRRLIDTAVGYVSRIQRRRFK